MLIVHQNINPPMPCVWYEGEEQHWIVFPQKMDTQHSRMGFSQVTKKGSLTVLANCVIDIGWELLSLLRKRKANKPTCSVKPLLLY